jgi:hypothetical protein
MRKRRGTLTGRLDVAISLPKWAPGMLVDFANASEEWFRKQWRKKYVWKDLLTWTDESEGFSRLQETVRQVWRGTASGGYEVSRHLGLGEYGSEREADGSPLHIDWKRSTIWFRASDLNEILWFTLLRYSQDLGICANEKSEKNPRGTCVTPYFIKYRPQQQFCCEDCTLPAQRESKRRWWNEHRKTGLEASRDKTNKKSGSGQGKRGSNRRVKQ